MTPPSPAPSNLAETVVSALRKVFDPEIPINIYDLGLIYRLDVTPEGRVEIDMTLTAPNCPVADTIVDHVKRGVQAVEGVTDVDVRLVWQPPWSPERMSGVAELELHAMGIDPKRAKETSASRPTPLRIEKRR